MQQDHNVGFFLRGLDMVSRKTDSGGRREPADYGEAGRWLRDLRCYWQLTQAELAEQAGIPDPAIIEWIETGEIRPPAFVYAAYARAFSMDHKAFAESCEMYYKANGTAAAA
jgi:DNA-binding XRE family transcriptional regulator